MATPPRDACPVARLLRPASQMLAAMAASNPRMLPQLGLTPDFLQAQLARAERFAQLQHLTPAQKGAADRAAWVAWLRRYRARLAQARAPAPLAAGVCSAPLAVACLPLGPGQGTR